jgi:dinuclear metal center YbgI/SA1388 family protein
MSAAITPQQLVAWLDDTLPTERCKDYGPNGLQVEAASTVSHIASACTADLTTITSAIAAGADALLVHHGIFWGKAQPLAGMLGRRVSELYLHRLNLIAYHLPLDACPTWGNNAWLVHQLGAKSVEGLTFAAAGGLNLGMVGEYDHALAIDDFQSRLETIFPDGIRWAPAPVPLIKRFGVVSGGGQHWHLEAADLGCDAFISGEAGEQNYHQAREGTCHYYAVGHSASERHAVHELAEALAQHFGLQHTRIQDSNPF